MYTPVPTNPGIVHLVCKYPVLLLVITITAGATGLYVSPVEQSCDHSFVSFTFDDGYLDTYTTAAPILDKYAYTGTAYVTTGYIGTDNHMSIDNIQDLQGMGWEIGTHGVTHTDFDTLSYEEVIKEIRDSKVALTDEGITVTSVSPPYGANPKYSMQMLPDLQQLGYMSLRTASNTLVYNNIPVSDRYKIAGFVVKSDTTVDEVKAAITYAKNNDKWLVLVFHSIGGSNYYAYPEDKFEEIVKFVRDNNYICASSLQK